MLKFVSLRSVLKQIALIPLEIELTVHCCTAIVNVSLRDFTMSHWSNFKLHCFGIIFIHEIFWRKFLFVFILRSTRDLRMFSFGICFQKWWFSERIRKRAMRGVSWRSWRNGFLCKVCYDNGSLRKRIIVKTGDKDKLIAMKLL